MNIRRLDETDAEIYEAIRLRSLQEHPEAFGAAYEDEVTYPLERTITRLTNVPHRATFGAFGDDQLWGVGTVYREDYAKVRHRAHLAAMYVQPEARGQGVGRGLMAAILDFARQMEGVEDVVLAVTAGNMAARRLYDHCGFRLYATDPRYLKVGDRYYDLEWMILSLRG